MSKRVASCLSAQVAVSEVCDHISRSLLCLHVPPPTCLSVLVGGAAWLEHHKNWDLCKDMAQFLRVRRAGVHPGTMVLLERELFKGVFVPASPLVRPARR